MGAYFAQTFDQLWLIYVDLRSFSSIYINLHPKWQNACPKKPGTSFSQKKKPLRGATQHRTGLVIYVNDWNDVIWVTYVYANYANLRKLIFPTDANDANWRKCNSPTDVNDVNWRKLDSSFSKISSHDLPYKAFLQLTTFWSHRTPVAEQVGCFSEASQIPSRWHLLESTWWEQLCLVRHQTCA